MTEIIVFVFVLKQSMVLENTVFLSMFTDTLVNYFSLSFCILLIISCCFFFNILKLLLFIFVIICTNLFTAPLLPKKEPFLTKVTPSSATLSWLPASLSSGVPSKPIVYKIEGREPPSTLWYEITSRLPVTSFNLQFLYPDQDYMFRVTADYDGVESEPTMSVYLPRRAGESIFTF